MLKEQLKEIEEEIYYNGEIRVKIVKIIKYIKATKDDWPNNLEGVSNYTQITSELAKEFDIEFDDKREIGYVTNIEDKIKLNDYIYSDVVDKNTIEVLELSEDKINFKISGSDINRNYFYKINVDLFGVRLKKVPNKSESCYFSYNQIYECHKPYPENLDALNSKSEKLAMEYVKLRDKYGSWGEEVFYESYIKYFRFFRNALLRDNDKLYLGIESIKDKIKLKEKK